MNRASWLLGGLLALVVATSANAASISYYLNQGNDPEGWLPDGTNYAQVTIADSVTPGDIDFTITLLSPLTSIADANFGIIDFYFNSTNVLSAANIVGEPGDWTVATDYNPAPPNMNADGFGFFEVRLSAGTRQNPTLSFSISILGDSIADYAVASTNSVEGTTYFGLHVGGFLDQDPAAPLDPIDIGNPGIGQCYDTDGQGNYTAGCNILVSGYFGGTNVVPEPSTALLLGTGFLGLAWYRRRQ